MLDLLQHYPSPAALAAAGEKRIGNRLIKLAPRLGRRLAAEIVQALGEQTVVVIGTSAASVVVPRLAAQLASLRRQRDEVLVEVEALVEAHPLHPVLTSMPEVGVRTAARLLTEVAGKPFPTAGHLASYAGLAPVTRRSGSSIRGEHPSRRGNKVLKRALFLSAFAALRDPVSRAYYDRKIGQGKRHNEALIALARRRCDVLHAMLRDGTLYTPPTRQAAIAVDEPHRDTPRWRTRSRRSAAAPHTAPPRASADRKEEPHHDQASSGQFLQSKRISDGL